MNFRNNRGSIGVDVSIAFTIILILIPVITGIIININKTNASISRKSQALNIAITCIETFKSYEKEAINEITEEKITLALKEYYGIPENDSFIVARDGGIQYKVELSINDDESDDTKIKTMNVNVIYKIGGKEQTVTLNTSIYYYV